MQNANDRSKQKSENTHVQIKETSETRRARSFSMSGVKLFWFGDCWSFPLLVKQKKLQAFEHKERERERDGYAAWKSTGPLVRHLSQAGGQFRQHLNNINSI